MGDFSFNRQINYMEYRVIVSGWRYWPRSHAWVIQASLEMMLLNLISSNDDDMVINMCVVEGECPYGGVDLFAKNWALSAQQRYRGRDRIRVYPEEHPADWISFGKGAGPKRNQKMVDAGANFALVFPHSSSRGTTGCLEMLIKADIPVEVIQFHPLVFKNVHDKAAAAGINNFTEIGSISCS